MGRRSVLVEESGSNPADSKPLRRSKRRFPISSKEDSSAVLDGSLPTVRKVRRRTGKSKTANRVSVTASPAPPTLLTLPYDVLRGVLGYLDVMSIEALGNTCSYFDLMIYGSFLTTVNVPMSLSGGFLGEVRSKDVLQKKPLLRLECKKPRRDAGSDLPQQVHSLVKFAEAGFEVREYILDSQMRLLSLSKLRELDLVPEDVDDTFTASLWECAQHLDCLILYKLDILDALKNISRLDVVLATEELSLQLWKAGMPSLINLLELNIMVLERKAGAGQREEYVYGYLEEIVKVSKAPRLNLRILSENKRIKNIPKLLASDYVEQLHVSAPCTFSLSLVMKKITEVSLTLSEASGSSKDCCSYLKSRLDDRELHRSGLCIIHLGALYSNCQNLQKFNGVEVGQVDQELEFPKWNAKVKKLFYKDYVNKGGMMEFKVWGRKRWFSKRPQLPAVSGQARLQPVQ